MSALYKLVRIEKNQSELTVELNENQLELIAAALNEYGDIIYDVESPYYEEKDANDLSDLQFKLNGVV